MRLKPHRRFRAEGRDLYTDLAVSPWEAALGAEVPVRTLVGDARVKVPPGSSSGRRLRLRGQGLPGSSGAPELDDGRLTDAQGRTVNFRNAVIIMTSNIGSLYLLDGQTGTGESRGDARERVMGELRAQFRPEFLNRVDDIVLFKPLTLGEIERIVDLQIADVRARLAGRRLGLELTEEARAFIARQGYEPVYGARPLRRFIQREVETRIGRALIAGEIGEGATITVDADGEALTVRWGEVKDAAPEGATIAA